MRETTRLIVKGFAPYVNEERLRAHFSKTGEVTDARVCRTLGGQSRQFGFVGFRTAEEAAAAKAFFHLTFLDTRRITVDFALPPTASALAAQQRSAKKSVCAGPVREVLRKARAEQARSAAEHDPELAAAPYNGVAEDNQHNSDEAVDLERSESSRFHQVTGAGLRLAPQTTPGTSEHRKNEHRHRDPLEVRGRLVEPSPPVDAASAKKQTMSDTASKTMHLDRGSEETPTSMMIEADAVDDTARTVAAVPPDSAAGMLCQSNRIFIRNLSFTATVEDLEELFEPISHPEDVHMVKDRESGRFLGTAFIRFASAADAQKAIDTLDRTVFQGRLLHIMPAEPDRFERRQKQNVAERGQHWSFSQERKRQRREDAGSTKDTVAWNPFFISADAVLETASSRLHASKGQFIGTDTHEPGVSAAVRLAVAESSLLHQVRDHLTKSGVNVQVLLDQQQRQHKPLDRKQLSRTTIVMKNLPAGTSTSDLQPKLARYGHIGRFVIAPGGLMAIVEFPDENQAKAAFRSLSYTRYGELPLYLEWAPRNVWTETPPVGSDTGASLLAGTDEGKHATASDDTPPEAPANWSATSLLIRNLSLDTTQTMLLDHIEQLGARPRVVRIPLDRAHMPNGPKVSTAPTKYAFAEFSSPEEAWLALNAIHGSVLNGYRLAATRSVKHIASQETAPETELETPSESPNQTKLIVKNIAFEASKRELRQLFGSFGHLKSLRLPRKFDGSGRGFCFLDYATPQESARAKALAQGTHFYGRKLVIEYSQV
ncbi:RNA binding motif protein 19 [Cyanidiococcus yangmingshanensis]|uniref:RNA binding motif protein 19 n=1 Tax=Cyanidiococcus yangmingshanensis TaxID=2690220 RepID=A0A7J7IP51_9RHOD|nr:RNA binding motif protein 19 [Cyanidiococcus yangmingshanensis]